MKKQAELVNCRHALWQMGNAGARREEPAGRITGERRCGDLETDKGTEIVRGKAKPANGRRFLEERETGARFVLFPFALARWGDVERGEGWSASSLTGGDVGVVGSAGERVGWFGQTCDGLAGSFIFLLILETCDGLEMAKWGNVSIRTRNQARLCRAL